MPTNNPLPWDPRPPADESRYHNALWDPFVAEFPELLRDHDDDVIDYLTGVAMSLRAQPDDEEGPLDVECALQFHAEEWFPDIDQERLSSVIRLVEGPVLEVCKGNLARPAAPEGDPGSVST